MADLEFARDVPASRWTLRRDGELLSVLDYRDDGRTVAMTRAYTVPTHRGHGFAALIVDHAVSELERSGDRTVQPVCWFVADWFTAHPDRAVLLAQERPRPSAAAG
ncbi:GNAT family N-acetyltransferase [Microbacterium gorillae]|uniref:GNAT family N-acetyltransferase n=1 Tax=Microbacterium gorillae TaxID=1231063 RepID=UPI0005901A78|nr:GNAT family N-acetyltransferase [Microbacterium gorillae]